MPGASNLQVGNLVGFIDLVGDIKSAIGRMQPTYAYAVSGIPEMTRPPKVAVVGWGVELYLQEQVHFFPLTTHLRCD